MKKAIGAIILGLGLLLAGCVDNPSFVGNWKSMEIPEELKEDGLSEIEMDIMENGTLLMSIVDGEAVDTEELFWEQVSEKEIAIMESKGDDSDASGILLEKKVMEVTADGISVKFKRQ